MEINVVIRFAAMRYQVDDYVLDLRRFELRKSGRLIPVEPQVLSLLFLLIENRDRLVSKDELIEAVWLETAVTDESLVQCLKDIRRALDDKSQTFIKTVPRRGYIFEKEVSENYAATVYTVETTGVHLVIEETEETNEHGNAEMQVRRGDENLFFASPRPRVSASAFVGAIRHEIALIERHGLR